MSELSRFETLEHTVYGGERHLVPLYIDPRAGVTEESGALLHAVNIIGGNLERFEEGLEELAAKVEGVASQNPYDPTKGVIISDHHSSSSVSIDGLNTRIAVDNLGVWNVDTALVVNMLRAWIGIAPNES